MATTSPSAGWVGGGQKGSLGVPRCSGATRSPVNGQALPDRPGSGPNPGGLPGGGRAEPHFLGATEGPQCGQAGKGPEGSARGPRSAARNDRFPRAGRGAGPRETRVAGGEVTARCASPASLPQPSAAPKEARDAKHAPAWGRGDCLRLRAARGRFAAGSRDALNLGSRVTGSCASSPELGKD